MRSHSFVGSLILAFAISQCPAAILIPMTSNWSYSKGFSEASSPDPTMWRNRSFDDSTWSLGQAPFYYENQPGNATEYTGNTLLSDMFGGYTSVFLRRTFVVTNVSDLSELQLSGMSDDGFLAWINGTNVARFNMPTGEIPFDGTALGALAEPVPVETVTISNPKSFLINGTNVLAVHAFNASLGQSSDFIIDVSLSGTTDTTPPAMAAVLPPDGAIVRALTSVEVDFSEDVAGVDAADLLINGVPATSVSAFNASQYLFSFPQPATGAIQVAWRTGHGITDLAGTPNAFQGGTWNYTLDPNAPPPGVNISEFMADNQNTINDEDGDASDWIEIHNSGTAVANLGGWYLTDEQANLSKWRFPAVSLPPDGYLLVFASGKDRTNPLARLHTSFKLNKDGSYLALVDSATNVISEFALTYPQQYPDISYGRAQGAVTVLGYFVAPTPGTANSASGAGFSADVVFSRPAGAFTTTFSLTLSAASAGAVIRYTTDGSLPTATSAVYSSPISVGNTMQVRARAFEPGLLPGPLRSKTYVLLNANVINFTSDLPLMIIHNYGAGSVPASQDQIASISLFEPGASGKTSLTNLPVVSARAAINLRGSSTLGYPKSSFAVEFHDDFDANKDVSLLGMPDGADWVLYAPNNFEPILIHNPLAYELSNQIGRYAPRTRFVEVYLNTGGGAVSSANYNGIYVLEEKIKRGKDRVDVDKLEPEHVNPPQVTGGYMMKIDRLGPGENGFGAAGQSMAYVDPSETEIELPQRTPQRQYLTSYMNSFGTALNSSSYTNPLTGFRAYVDVDPWIDHHILNVLSFNVDALRLSAYFYKPRNGKLAFGPIWDFDRALGSTDGRDSNPRVWRSQSGDLGTDFFNYPWWGRMFTDADFWQRWIDRWQELRTDRFAQTNLNALVDSLCNQVRSSQPRELARWGVQPRGGTYQAEIDYSKNWLTARANFIDTNFLARPVLSRVGGPITAGTSLTISGPSGATIYYTLDGSDPRQSGGGLSPNALTYSGPILLNNNARVVARARNLSHANLTGANNPPISSPWSGVVAATFVVQTPPLIITEIMYHPEPPPAGNTNDAENFEYIELRNRGASTLNLVGFSFTNGIDYTFTAASSITNLAAGQRVLLVRNRPAFTSRYPALTNIAGEYVGNLDNAGERLALIGSLMEPIHDFRYENSWYPITDGPGFSLVVVDENAALSAWTNKTGWRPSGVVGGSPGQPDSTPPVISRVLVTEALTHTDPPLLDAVEICNTNSTPVDVGGWFISDDFNAPKKYRIPGGTSIPAGGFRAIYETEFNDGSPVAFRLSSLGDQVYLFSANASSNLTGYFHGFDFGAAQNGVSFGRYVTSVGAEHFVAQSANTLGSVNAGPRVGPVVINEILFNPPPNGTNNNTLDEFIELRNITGLPVPLFDPAAPTNTWKLSGGVDFLFPTNMTLTADGYLLVVNFDPMTNATQLASFRQRYGVATGVPLVGPYGGAMSNTGEKISLYRPDPPQTIPDPYVGFVPYVLIDRVEYSSSTPWPTNTSGSGNSLQRILGGAYGDDPINWRSGAPTAGAVNPGGGSTDTDGDGLPDDWEIANNLDYRSAAGDDGALGDPDGDGLNNLQEYISGTNPRDAGSFLKIESVTSVANTARIQFLAVAGKTYTVLYQTNLTASPWIKLTNVAPQSMTGLVEVSDPVAVGSTTRYYRLATPQLP